MSTGSFPGVKRNRRGVDHPPSSSDEVKEKVELYLYFPSGLSWPVIERTLLYLALIFSGRQPPYFEEIINSIHSLVFSLESQAWQEPEPSHVTGMALAHCILGKFLG